VLREILARAQNIPHQTLVLALLEQAEYGGPVLQFIRLVLLEAVHRLPTQGAL
jgi:hypothetical protein